MDEIFCRYFSELSQLGRGAFGDVSLARRVSDGLLVAVKRVNLGALTDEKALTVCAWGFFFALSFYTPEGFEHTFICINVALATSHRL